jgi:dTMP kinase
MMTGLFITFEGPDGAGKTTQLRLLAEYLEKSGYTVRCTREPGGTVLSDQIRSLLLDPAYNCMDSRAEALLYMAARAQHVAELIAPALERGEVVISDRYADSTIVYQGVARKLERAALININNFATSGLTPHLTLLLDGDVSVLGGRMAGRGGHDRIEQEDRVFHEAVRQGFLELAAAEPDRIKVIGGSGAIADIHQAVIDIVDEFMNRRSRRED